MTIIIIFDFLLRATGIFILLELAWFFSRILAAALWRNDA